MEINIPAMAQDNSGADCCLGLIRDQVRLVKRKHSDRYEVAPIHDQLSFEKGYFVVFHACQLLVQKNDGIILVGVAGPSGAGKTAFTEKILNILPGIAVISMDNYNDSSRIVDGNFDDPRVTDYETLLRNIRDLKEGKPVQVPIYDFKSSSRTGYRTVDVPSSRIVIIEGIYALSEKLRLLLDLRVSVTGGVHLDLVKRVIRDIQRAGQEPEEIIHQISETVYPMYKAFIEPDLQTAHIKIINKFNPFIGFQSPTYILKSARNVTVDQIKAVLSEDFEETTEQTYDIYLLPPGEDPESCQSYLRMRNKDGKYNLMFEEWVTNNPFIISPRITFAVSVRLLGGLMALGYTIATILKRSSRVLSDDRVCVKLDWLEQLNRHYVQVQGRDRLVVIYIAQQMGLEGSYIPRTYIQQIQLEKLVNGVVAMPDDLRTKLRLDEDLMSSPKEALFKASTNALHVRHRRIRSDMSQSCTNQRDKNQAKVTGYVSNNRVLHERDNSDSVTNLANQGAITILSEQISSLNDRMDEFTNQIQELNSKLTIKKNCASQQNIVLQAEACNGSAPTSHSITSLNNRSLTRPIIPNSSSPTQFAKETPLADEVTQNWEWGPYNLVDPTWISTNERETVGKSVKIAMGQRQIIHQLDNLNNLLCGNTGDKPHQTRTNRKSVAPYSDSTGPNLILAVAVGCLGIFLVKGLLTRN